MNPSPGERTANTAMAPPAWLRRLARWSRGTPYFKGKWRLVNGVFRCWLKHRRFSEVVQLERKVVIQCDLWDEGPHAIWWCGTAYELHETRFLLQYLQPDMTFLDVGANIGYYTLLAATRVESVHAFEPVARQFRTLRANVERNSFRNVKLNQLIVSDRTGSMTIRPGPPEHSGIACVTSGEDPAGQAETVAAVTLDDYIQEHSLARVDVVKVDVEGHEMRVLLGSRCLLATQRPSLLLEVKRPHLQKSGSNPAQLFELLRKAGYQAWRIAPGGRTVKLEAPQEGKLVLFQPC